MVDIDCPPNYSAILEKRKLTIKNNQGNIIFDGVVVKNTRHTYAFTATRFVNEFIAELQTNEELIKKIKKAFENKDDDSVEDGLEAIAILRKRLEEI